jgi:hypothetical protein
VHPVLVQVILAHRLEGAGTDVQGDLRGLDADAAGGLQHRLVEVQPGGGRRDGPVASGIDGLVALPVRGVVGALDVGRQRHMAVARISLPKSASTAAEPEQPLVAPSTSSARRPPTAAGAGAGRLARAHMRDGLAPAEHALEQDLDATAGLLARMQPRRHHPGIVEDQQVARRQQRPAGSRTSGPRGRRSARRA